MEIWRLCKTVYASNPFNGIGGMYAAGRWHSIGTLFSYAANDPTLPIVENLVHAQGRNLSHIDYSIIKATLDDALIDILDPKLIPNDWERIPPGLTTQRIGDGWVNSMSSVETVLKSV